MSTQEVSFERFTMFFNRLHNMLHGYFKSASDFCAEAERAISSNKLGRNIATVSVPPQGLRPKRALTPKELERFYAKPGEAEWGC